MIESTDLLAIILYKNKNLHSFGHFLHCKETLTLFMIDFPNFPKSSLANHINFFIFFFEEKHFTEILELFYHLTIVVFLKLLGFFILNTENFIFMVIHIVFKIIDKIV